MSKNIPLTSGGHCVANVLPDKCPFCHKSITPNIIIGYLNKRTLETFLSCPDDGCRKSFVAYYDFFSLTNYHYANRTSFGSTENKAFNPILTDLSPSFVKIYNESLQAESRSFLEICGVGYRKALEFLIKDYAVKNNPEKEDEIKAKKLSSVISEYVNDNRIKEVARRAVWLGNDETHYVRKWEGRDLCDLKKLIDLTVHWIEMEELTSSFSEDMPE